MERGLCSSPEKPTGGEIPGDVGAGSAVKRAGLNLTLHDLRRVYLNRLREKGVSLETAMALTGHRNVATVMKYYREVSQDELASAVESIDGPAARENTAEEQSS